LNYPTLETARVDIEAIAKTYRVSGKQVGGFITQASTSPKIRSELKALGFTAKQIPRWIGAKRRATSADTKQAAPEPYVDPDPDANTSIPEPVQPAGIPIVDEARSTLLTASASGSASVPASGSASVPASGSASVPASGSAYHLTSPVAEVLEVEDQDGVVGQIAPREAEGPTITPIGALDRSTWIKENGLIKFKDQYLRNIVLKDGRTAMVIEPVPETILKEEVTGSTRLSEQMYRVLEGTTDVLVRKIALNPDIFNFFFWLKNKGYLNEKEDMADLLNYALKFYMKHAFGAQVMMIVDERQTLLSLLKRQDASGARIESIS
jgi:hypothetical protein